ncbi:MAG: hypothetical protein KDD24_03955 [Flavobacteriales bacterium]|nr:hypothetical protein [Flavobacteriales bacterium]MCB9175342.1 hypothetical protein [Flavobacteriales bacterium]
MRISFQISSILVALLFVFSINFKSILTVHYFVNQAEIIEMFCVNKEKPKLACNGKCHLAKELVKVDTKNEENPFSGTSLQYNLEIKPLIQQVKNDLKTFEQDIKTNYFLASYSIIEQSFDISLPPPKV